MLHDQEHKIITLVITLEAGPKRNKVCEDGGKKSPTSEQKQKQSHKLTMRPMAQKKEKKQSSYDIIQYEIIALIHVNGRLPPDLQLFDDACWNAHCHTVVR